MTGERYMELTGGIKTSMFPQLSSVFGMWPVEVATEMREKGFTYLRSTDEVYSFNGTDTYLVAGFENIKEVEFVYNSDNVVSQYWLYVSEATDQLEIYHYLNENYFEAKEEEVSGYGFIYYNQEKTLKVHYKLWENAVVFTNLTQKAFDQVILRNFWKGLGMTRNELIATFGTPDRDREDDGGNVRYVGLYDYIINCDFIFDSTLGIYRQVQIYLREGVAQEVVKGYLNRLYTFYETAFADGAEVLRWVNSSNPADVNMRISYYPDYGVVVYGQFTVPVPPPFDYSKFLRKTKSEVKDMMTGKSLASESDSRILYLLDNDDYGVRVRFDFSGDTVEKAILWLRDDASPSAIKDALGAYYNFTDEGNGYTNYYSNDEKTRVLYQEDIKVIQFIARN